MHARFIAISLAALALLATPALTRDATAADFQVSAHTSGQFFEYINVQGNKVPKSRLTQYLRMNGYDLLGDGKNTLSLKTGWRFDTDLSLEDDDIDLSQRPENYGLDRRHNAFHLMYAYVEGKNLWNTLDFKAGRQLLSDVLGWYDFDGIWTSVRLFSSFFLDVYGGAEVKTDAFVLNDAAFDPDGTSPVGSRFGIFDRQTYGIGAALKWIDLTTVQATLTYRRTFWNIVSGVETDKLGAHTHFRVADTVKIWGGAVFNFFITNVDFAEAGFEITMPDSDMTVAVEYFRQIPTFDGDSIFNVFSVQAYDDIRARYGWQVDEDLYTSIRIGARLYSSGDKGIEGTIGEDFMGTARLKVKWRPGAGIWTWLTHQTEIGLGGRKHYTQVGANSPWYHDLWRLDGRVLHANFDADYTQALEGNAFGARLGGSLKVLEYGRFDLYFEEAVNPLIEHEFRAYAMLDLDFWF